MSRRSEDLRLTGEQTRVAWEGRAFDRDGGWEMHSDSSVEDGDGVICCKKNEKSQIQKSLSAM